MVIIAFFFLFLFILLFDAVLLIKIISDIQSARGGAPYVGIPIEVAREALKLAQVGPDDTLYDLGCGDGRVLRLALEKFGVKKAVGYEIGLWPIIKFKVQSSKFKIKTKSSKLKKIKIHNKNLLEANLYEAIVVFLYLYPKLLAKLIPKLQAELPAGACIISCRYPLADINDFKIVKTGEVKGIKIWVYTKSLDKPAFSL